MKVANSSHVACFFPLCCVRHASRHGPLLCTSRFARPDHWHLSQAPERARIRTALACDGKALTQSHTSHIHTTSLAHTLFSPFSSPNSAAVTIPRATMSYSRAGL
ncbi:hypothetical protein OG21DRAFT_379831 [Imleria badia]|nr:hypothetical protein OG21DRAFT_379831 [Imleria badia]